MKTINGLVNGINTKIDVSSSLKTMKCAKHDDLSVKVAIIEGVKVPVHHCKQCDRYFIGDISLRLYID